MKNRQMYLVAYDISDNRARNTALKLCRQYATGGQKSLHECWLSDRERAALISDLHQIINEHSDRITLVRLDARQSTFALGRGTLPLDPAIIVVS
jgi:CRISPR-associated protein Cas2